MLTIEQHRHFTEHGWVLLNGVLSGQLCRDYMRAIDRVARTRRMVPVFPMGDDTVQLENLPLDDDIFVDWLRLPGLLSINRQLMGADLRVQGVSAQIKSPHPERQSRRQELRDLDAIGWHRALRPRWGHTPDEKDASLLNSAFLNNITYLTPVGPGDGGTAILDGSHRHDGDYPSLKDRCPVIEVAAPAGSVLVFTETLVHSAIPIVSENTRYNMYYEFVLPWFCSHKGWELPEMFVERQGEEELRRILGGPSYRGQERLDAE